MSTPQTPSLSVLGVCVALYVVFDTRERNWYHNYPWDDFREGVFLEPLARE